MKREQTPIRDEVAGITLFVHVDRELLPISSEAQKILEENVRKIKYSFETCHTIHNIPGVIEPGAAGNANKFLAEIREQTGLNSHTIKHFINNQ